MYWRGTAELHKENQIVIKSKETKPYQFNMGPYKTKIGSAEFCYQNQNVTLWHVSKLRVNCIFFCLLARNKE